MAKQNNLVREDVIDAIEEHIDLNQLKANDALPSERELTLLCGVSRGTIREALGRMQLEGRIISIHGKGNFIAPEKCHIDMKDFISFSDSVLAQGKVAKSKMIGITVAKADRIAAELLSIPQGSPIYVLSRVRSIDGEDLLLEVSHIPARLCKGLENHDFAKLSLYRVLGEKYGIQMTKQDIEVKLSRASAQEARLLDLFENDTVFVEKAVAYAKDNQPVEYTKTIVNAKRINYTIDIKSA